MFGGAWGSHGIASVGAAGMRRLRPKWDWITTVGLVFGGIGLLTSVVLSDAAGASAASLSIRPTEGVSAPRATHASHVFPHQNRLHAPHGLAFVLPALTGSSSPLSKAMELFGLNRTVVVPAVATAPVVPPAPPVPPRGQATAFGCAAAIAYLHAYADPGFTIACPGTDGGHQATTTCVNGSSPCSGEKLIIIADPCAAAYMNEASNSWVISGLARAPIDPYGQCY
jgi:hypothetical protein